VADRRSALVLFSGGQDSTVCLAWALERYARVETVGFDYGQRHRIELECRGAVRAALRAQFPDWAEHGSAMTMCSISRRWPDLRQRADHQARDRARCDRPAQHLRAGAQPALLHVRGGAGLSHRAERAGRRHVRDRLLRLSGLPRQHPVRAAGRDQPGPGRADDDRDPADAEALGGAAWVEIVREHTHTCYLGKRGRRHGWGYGCGTCPACVLRRDGHAAWLGGA
jgi:7-cyano-7-deazaguanine synthase